MIGLHPSQGILLFFFQNNALLSNVFTTEREVHNQLKTVDVCKACGPDGIGNR